MFTDPVRTPDPLGAVMALPPGCGVVYRHFGKSGREAEARRLRSACGERGHVLLIAADPALAAKIGADGVHWPERLLPGAARRSAAARFALNSAAAHSPRALRRAASAGMDLAFFSPAFPGNSPSAAARAAGPLRLRILARGAPLPVYALGGVRPVTALRLAGSEISGFAAVEALSGRA